MFFPLLTEKDTKQISLELYYEAKIFKCLKLINNYYTALTLESPIFVYVMEINVSKELLMILPW
jgi:hypothetical protein